jgi:hypothetical protein
MATALGISLMSGGMKSKGYFMTKLLMIVAALGLSACMISPSLTVKGTNKAGNVSVETTIK